MNIAPPEFPEKKGSDVRVVVSLPAGHAAHFVGSGVIFIRTDTGGEWDGTLVGSGSSIYDPAKKRLAFSQDAFSPQAEIRGGTLRGSWIQESAHDHFSYKVESGEGFPKEFSVRLPGFAVDEIIVVLPVVHFRYGKGLALCGCCGV